MLAMPSPITKYGPNLDQIEISVRELEAILAANGEDSARALMDEVRFADVESLTLTNGRILADPVFSRYYLDMPKLRALTIPFFPETSALLDLLAGASWWRQLRAVSLQLVGGVTGLDTWAPLWNQPELMLEELKLGIVVTRHAIDVVNGKLPKLRVLALKGQAYEGFVPALLDANLPALTDLDLRETHMDVDAIRQLTRSPRPGLPSLIRLGLLVNSGREAQYTDWNGAVVWSGEEWMDDQEIYLNFLMGTGLIQIRE
jgi:hypothetical protein